MLHNAELNYSMIQNLEWRFKLVLCACLEVSDRNSMVLHRENTALTPRSRPKQLPRWDKSKSFRLHKSISIHKYPWVSTSKRQRGGRELNWWFNCFSAHNFKAGQNDRLWFWFETGLHTVPFCSNITDVFKHWQWQNVSVHQRGCTNDLNISQLSLLSQLYSIVQECGGCNSSVLDTEGDGSTGLDAKDFASLPHRQNHIYFWSYIYI